MVAGGGGQLRRGGLDAQRVGVAGVDAAEKRVDQPLVHLVAETGPHQRTDRAVAVGAVAGSTTSSPARARPRGDRIPDRATAVSSVGSPSTRPVGQGPHPAAGPEEGLAADGATRSSRPTAWHRSTPSGTRAMNVRAELDRSSVERLGADLAAGPVVGVDHDDLALRIVGAGTRRSPAR